MPAAAGAGCLAGLGVGQALALLAPVTGPADPALLDWIPLGWIPLGWGLAVARLVFDVTGVVTVGLTLLPLLLREARPREAAVALAAAHRRLVVAGAVWAGSAVLLVWLQVAVATGEPPLEVPAGRVTDYLGAAVAGRALVVAAVCGLAVAATGAVAGRRPGLFSAGLPAVPAVLGVLALPVTGHAATASLHELAVIAVAVHVAAAAGWVGGLGAVVWLAAPRRELLAAALPRYSRLATACLIAVASTGVLGAVLRLGPGGPELRAALFGTPYGWMLLGKGLGVVTLGLLGARARARLLPAVRARRAARLTGWVAIELAVMGTVVGLASVLAEAVGPA